MLLRMQIAPLSYCSIAPCLAWLEAPLSFTVSIGANSIMDNAIEEVRSWKRMMLHMDITLMSFVSFNIEPLACLGSKQSSSLTPLAAEQVLLWVMPSCKCCHCSSNTKPLAIAKAPLPKRHRLSAIARAPEQRSPPKAQHSGT